MTMPITPWRAEVYRLLADGEWHDRETIMREIQRTIPPTRAYRRGERLRRNTTGNPQRTVGDHNDSVRSGKRDLARDAVRAHRAHRVPGPNSALESRTLADGTVQIRLLEGFRRRLNGEEPLPTGQPERGYPFPGTPHARTHGCLCPSAQAEGAFATIALICPLHGWLIGSPDPD